MNLFRQIGAVTAMNFRSLPQRVGTSLVIVIGIAGVVAVLVSVLAMSTGMIADHGALGSRRSRHRAAQRLRVGDRQRARIATPARLDRGRCRHQAQRAGQADRVGGSAAPGESASRRRTAPRSTSSLRGVGPQVHELRPELKIVEGRMFKPAVTEVIVGKAAHAQFKGLNVGDKIKTRGATWTVVGVFTTGGDSHESALMTDAETLISADQRGGFQSVTVLLDSPAAFQKFKDALTSNPALAVDVQPRARVLPPPVRRRSARSSPSSRMSSAASWRSARSSAR